MVPPQRTTLHEGTPSYVADVIELASPEGTRRVLRTFAIRPRKRWGQHFLVSRRALDGILAAASVTREDKVMEVGAGLGTLTAALAEQADSVIAIERDPQLLPALRATMSKFSNVQIIEADIMEADLGTLLQGGKARKVVSNLPFNIASPLIVRILEQPLGIRRLVLTVQREVAERVAAQPGTRDYGALSVAVQYRAIASTVGRIPPGAFYPAPEVDSAIVLLQVRDQPPVAVGDEGAFFAVVRASFAQRRKTLRNALSGGLRYPPKAIEAASRAAGIDPRRRGETLTLEEFAALTRTLNEVSQGLAGRAR